MRSKTPERWPWHYLRQAKGNKAPHQKTQSLLGIELLEDYQGFFWIGYTNNEQSFLR